MGVRLLSGHFVSVAAGVGVLHPRQGPIVSLSQKERKRAGRRI